MRLSLLSLSTLEREDTVGFQISFFFVKDDFSSEKADLSILPLSTLEREDTVGFQINFWL